MTGKDIKRASLAELRAMKEANELVADHPAREGEDLGAEFWAKAELAAPEKRSVHLKVDREVFDFFYQEASGRGHLTKMQNVLRAYVEARRSAR